MPVAVKENTYSFLGRGTAKRPVNMAKMILGGSSGLNLSKASQVVKVS